MTSAGRMPPMKAKPDRFLGVAFCSRQGLPVAPPKGTGVRHRGDGKVAGIVTLS